MGLEDALPHECPHCKRADRLVRAVDVRHDATETAFGGVDVALPALEWWSLLLAGSVVAFMLSAMSMLGAAMPDGNNPVAVGLTVVALILGAMGAIRTRRNAAWIRAVEPAVRVYHEAALFCENCAHVHFEVRELPPGLAPCVAWTFTDYRRRLWYACGFGRSTFPARGLA